VTSTWAIGTGEPFSETVGEYDVYSFAGPISGDFRRTMSTRPNGEIPLRAADRAWRADGVGLHVGRLDLMAEKSRSDPSVTGASLGYDAMRFLAPVFFGETITVNIPVASIDRTKTAAAADIKSPTRTHAGRGSPDAFIEVG